MGVGEALVDPYQADDDCGGQDENNIMVMAKLGGQRFISPPLKVWSRDSTKIERLYLEGEFIWRWNPSLNDRGKGEETKADGLGKLGEFLLLGKRRRTRQLMKFRVRSSSNRRGGEPRTRRS